MNMQTDWQKKPLQIKTEEISAFTYTLLWRIHAK
jgi:hypothetical protein